MWDKIRIKKTRAYPSKPEKRTKDRIEITLDMPIEIFSDFRKQIEAAHTLRDRRKTDKTSEV